jgi:trans-aconitate methyltransferase
MATVAYWEEYHERHWGPRGGPEQSRYFASLILSHLPERIRGEMQRCATVCDFGCAQGDGTAVFASACSNARVTGIDFAANAIAKAKEKFPDIEFLCASVPDHAYDVVISSNVLEHYSDWQGVLRTLMASARRFIILLVPYREQYPLCEDHRATFDEFTFPDIVQTVPSVEQYRSERWRLAFQKIIPTERFWDGAQLLVVYEREA